MKKLFIIVNCVISFLELSAQGKWETLAVPFKHSIINTIVIDEKNTKWFGTDIGVFKFDDKNWKSYRNTNSKYVNIENNNFTKN